MRCPFCNTVDDRVVDSRSCRDGQAIRRRRECTSCSQRFTTYEYIEHAPLTVIKRDGNREPFDRSKLQAKIELACYKTSVSSDLIEELMDQVESELGNRAEREIPSKQIGELVMERLRNLDRVAYIRYASVYRDFRDIESFKTEVDSLLEPARSVGVPSNQLPLLDPPEDGPPLTPRRRRGRRPKRPPAASA